MKFGKIRFITTMISVMVFGAIANFSPEAPAPVSAALQTFDFVQLADSFTTTPPIIDPQAIQRIKIGGAKVSIAPQTGGVNFMKISEDQSVSLSPVRQFSLLPKEQAIAFLQANRSLFGIADASQELTLVDDHMDTQGRRHLSYTQVYQGLPVYGAVMKVHFNDAGQISVINGLFVPVSDINTTPALSRTDAEIIAIKASEKTGVTAQKVTLLIYRGGLAQGISGANYLAYEVEVGDGEQQRDWVYIDGLTGKVLNIVSGEPKIHRTVYQYNAVTPAVPTLIWDEIFSGGAPYTGADTEVQTVLEASGSIYQLYENISGGEYLSFDGNDAAMTSLVDYENPEYCPNASWNSHYIQACDGMASDDIVAHEWAHAYTEKTHNLIYQWQPGALNEAYSDIFGETIDLINSEGTDIPDTVRTTSTCSIRSSIENLFDINSPASLAGTYEVGGSSFSPVALLPITQDIVLVNDGIDVTADGCGAITNAAAVNGKIALIERGGCVFTTKVENAQAAGAAAVLIYNSAANGDVIFQMGGEPIVPITIPAVLLTNTLGQAIVDNLGVGVNATIYPYSGEDGGDLVDTVRWLFAEDTSSGVMRDMWDPTCMGNPGKVSDDEYYCADNAGVDNDYGGVHSNNGVPNHTFALLVDGGAYNGQTIQKIGLTKAIAVYWRAEQVYQTPLTDFAGHADILETSCDDLIGDEIYDLKTGNPVATTDRITSSDCEQVSKAIAATELRQNPTQCNYEKILDPDAPSSCSAGMWPISSFFDDFNATPSTNWTVDHQEVAGITSKYIMPDWELVDNLPGGRTGQSYFAVNSSEYGDCLSTNQTSTRRLISPEMVVKDSKPLYLAFDHYVAIENGYDGGNLWIKVNEADWTPITTDHFTFNGYNATLLDLEFYESTNPLAGMDAFTGNNPGEVGGSWGRSLVDLSSFVKSGDEIKLAFYLGQDGCSGLDGWYIDNVQVYTCTDALYFPLIGAR